MAEAKQKIKATVFIPTYNGEEYIGELLDAVFSQKYPFKYEVIIVDSSSTDKTQDIIKKYPEVKLHIIPKEDFGHGKTRLKGAQLAQGEYVVYLSQDAVPKNNKWLEYMCEPFEISQKVFCVFGKQSPRPFADAPTKREVQQVFSSLGPAHSISIARKKSLVSNTTLDSYLTFFSDVNSAVRRKYLLEKVPYRDVRYAEDQLLGKDVLDHGYLKAYAPLGEVWHSNEYTIRDYYYRKFDEYLGIYENLGVTPEGRPLSLAKIWLKSSVGDIPFIIKDSDYSTKQKAKYLLTSWVRNLLRQFASYNISNPDKRNKLANKHSLESRKD